ncbi:MAG TPA: ATP-binding cassette domain-containing protein, partial [Candidatus Xenobia bacterium]
DVRDLLQADLRRRMALVLQDVILFPGTVQDNLTLGDGTIAPGDLAEAIRVVGIEQVSDTVVAERGTNLSAGQRQLLSFARALARRPDVLLLDEATAAIDPHTERTVQRALERLLEGRTALIVAHRLSTVQNVDRILVMEHGRIVEQGTHQALLSQDGAYRQLHRLQNRVAEGVS